MARMHAHTLLRYVQCTYVRSPDVFYGFVLLAIFLLCKMTNTLYSLYEEYTARFASIFRTKYELRTIVTVSAPILPTRDFLESSNLLKKCQMK